MNKPEMKNKTVLITMIVLAAIFVPLTIIGALGLKNISPIEENPNHDILYNGYLWFYDKDNKFLSNYKCATKICGYTSGTIDDDTYGVNYYKGGTTNTTSSIKDRYAFITDGTDIHLFSLESGKVLTTYKSLKTYNHTIESGYYILQDKRGVWGVLSVNEMLGNILQFEYSFIGLKNKTNADGTINADKFIVMKNTKWYIVGKNGDTLSGRINEPIVDYTNEYIFSKLNNEYHIYSYDNHEYLENHTIKNYTLGEGYIGIFTSSHLVVYSELGKEALKSITITPGSQVELEKDGNKVNVKINGEVKESIELN